MEPRHKDALRHNLSCIVDDINPLELLVDLTIISASVKQTIEAQKLLNGDRRATSMLVDEIQRKGPRAFLCFVAALEKHRHYHVVDRILDELPVVESSGIRGELVKRYGHRRSDPHSDMPEPSGQNLQERQSIGYNGSRDHGVQKPEHTGKLLDHLPYGYTKILIKHLNKLAQSDFDKLKIVCELTRREAIEATDGEKLFDKLAEKNFKYDMLMANLEAEGLMWIFSRQESSGQSGSTVKAENGHSHLVSNSSGSFLTPNIAPSNRTLPPPVQQLNAGTTATHSEPSGKVVQPGQLQHSARVLPAGPQPSNSVAPPAEQNAGQIPDHHGVSKRPLQTRTPDASAQENLTMQADQLQKNVDVYSPTVLIEKDMDNLKLDEPLREAAGVHEIREVSLHGSNQPE